MANKDTSKQWFETGDFPTQAQFAQVFEWLRWKDEALGIGDITGLQDILNALTTPVQSFIYGPDWDGRYTIPAGFMLEFIIVIPAVDAYPYAQTVGGAGGDLVPLDLENIVTPAEPAVWGLYKYYGVEKVIEVVNVPLASIVKFVKRKIV